MCCYKEKEREKESYKRCVLIRRKRKRKRVINATLSIGIVSHVCVVIRRKRKRESYKCDSILRLLQQWRRR